MRTEKTFLVSEANIKGAESEVGRLNRKARKLGCPPLHLHIAEEPNHTKLEYANPKTSEIIWVKEGSKEHTTVQSSKSVWKATGRISPTYEVTLFGEAPAYDGWEFVATLVPNPARTKNMIFSLPGKECPKRFRSTVGQCDHCGINRYRRKTYVVTKNNEYKQVGSTCIKDFLGYNDPSKLLKRMEYLTDMATSLSDKALPGERQEAGIYLPVFMDYVAQEIRVNGWHSRTAAETTGGYATADIFYTFNSLSSLWSHGEPAEEDKALANKAIAWAKNLPGDVSNDYLYNLRIIAHSNVVTHRTHGMAASMIVAYRRAIRKAREIERLPKSEYVGEVGERTVFTVTLDKVHSVETMYGTMDILIFTDGRGNTLVWKTSSNPDFRRDREYRIRATVKDHNVFNNRKQTVVNRVNILEEVM